MAETSEVNKPEKLRRTMTSTRLKIGGTADAALVVPTRQFLYIDGVYFTSVVSNHSDSR